MAARLGDGRASTLMMRGALDRICPPEPSRLIASHMARAKRVVAPGGDHTLPAAAALAEVSGFLSGRA